MINCVEQIQQCYPVRFTIYIKVKHIATCTDRTTHKSLVHSHSPQTADNETGPATVFN